MKKIFAAVITAFLMSAGLVATTSSPAAAACSYPSECFATNTSAVGLNAQAPNRAKVFVKVTSFGNGRPSGQVVFTFVRNNGSAVTFTRAYSGGNSTYNFNGLRKGNYTVIVDYVPADDSQYLGSSDQTNVKVKGSGRRG